MIIIKVGIASFEEMKARTLDIARGEIDMVDEPKVWFISIEDFANALAEGNPEIMEMICKGELNDTRSNGQ